MAKKVTLLDDITGEEIPDGELAPPEKSTFTFDGNRYKLDLHNDTAKMMADDLAKYIDNASTIIPLPNSKKNKKDGEPEVDDSSETPQVTADETVDEPDQTVDIDGFPGPGTNYQNHTVPQRAVIRGWARDNGYKVKTGYVTTQAVDAFYDAYQT
jgi:hypothetical protein